MGWENRSGSRYYYRKERSGSHLRSVYVGRGEMVHLDAVLFAMQQKDRKAGRVKERRAIDATLHPLDTDIDALSRLTSTLTEAALIAAGFHQHKRQWRKRRE